MKEMSLNSTTFSNKSFALAILSIFLAFIITLFIPSLSDGGMYFLFLTAITFSTLHGDVRSGSFAAVVSFIVNLLLLYYLGKFPLKFGDWMVLIAFGLTSAFTIYICYAQMESEIARHLAESKYRMIFEDAITGIYETTVDGKYITANPKLATMFGYETAAKLILKAANLNEGFYVSEGRRKEFIRQISENGQISEFESEIYRCDGAKIWISENSVAVRNAKDNLIGFLGTSIEITARKRAESALQEAHEHLEEKVVERTTELERSNQLLREEIAERQRVEMALRQSEEKFRNLVETVKDWIWETDVNGIYTYASPHIRKLIGYEPEEIIGKRPYDLMPPDEAERVKQVVRKLTLEKKGHSLFESLAIHKNGSLITTETSNIPIYDEQGNLCGARGIARDITDRKRIESMIEVSEKRYRELVENAKDLIYTADLDGKLTSLNRAGKELVGITDDQVKTAMLADHVAPEFLTLVRQKLAEKLGGTERTVFELELIVEGHRCPVEVSSWIIYDENGEPSGTQGIARDIAERKMAEEKIRESQKMLQIVMDTIPQGVFWKNTDGVFLGCNLYVAQCAGLESGEQIIGLSDYDLPWTKEESDFYRECDHRVMETGVPELGIIETLRQADGTDIWLETNKVPLKNSVGETVGVLGTFKDITERKRTEAMLREIERRLHSIVTVAPIILCAVDSNGIFTLSEGKGLDLLKLRPGEVVGQSVFDLYQDFPEIIKDVRRALKGDTFLNTFKVNDLIFETRFLPILNEQGNVVEVIGVAIDVTGQKLVENELIASQRQLRELSAHLESVREEERKFIARELHDELGQTLTALKIDLTKLEERLPNLQTETVHQQIISRVPAMIEIVDMAMETTRKIVAQLRPAVLDELGLAEAAEWQVREFEKLTGINCDLDINLTDKNLSQNLKTAMFRILQECLTNITRHAAATKVKIELTFAGKILFFNIEDNGRGMGKQKMATTKSFGISGMRERTLLLGGKLEITRPENGGTQVTVRFPVE